MLLPPTTLVAMLLPLVGMVDFLAPQDDELLLSLTMESTEFELAPFDGSEAEGLRPPPTELPAPFERCLMFSRLLILNVSSNDWLDTHESFASTEPPYRKSPI